MKSKPAAWGAFALVVLILILTHSLRVEWWCYLDIFFLFMMAFCHAVAVTLAGANSVASRKIDMAAAVCGILALIAFAVEYVLLQVIG